MVDFNTCSIVIKLLLDKPTCGYKIGLLLLLLEITDPKNDLGPFMVTLQQSDALSFYGPCQLEIQPRKMEKLYFVAIYDMNQPPRLVVKWQIDHLRGYGSNESVLKIETGRLVRRYM